MLFLANEKAFHKYCHTRAYKPVVSLTTVCIKRMQGKTSCARGKGKAVETSKRPRRKVPRFNRGTIQVPEDFLKTGPSKWARMGKEPRGEIAP
ncbi:hypothetical protein ACOSP7_006840 [Xanthoceras sorbifolium]